MGQQVSSLFSHPHDLERDCVATMRETELIAGASLHWGALFIFKEDRQMENENLSNVAADADFDIFPAESPATEGYQKLDISSEQKLAVSHLFSVLPSLAAANTVATAYEVRFPIGLPHTLTKLKQGGYGSMVRGDNGAFAGSASFYKMKAQAVALSAVSVMSLASGQYFLSQINSKLNVMKLNTDKILEFLYGDKRSELISEIAFVKSAYQNYSSLMTHDDQRIATIVSLQAAKKTAMKDIEFYLMDLDSLTNSSNAADVETTVRKALQIRDSLELSTQLCIVSTVLETYYSENHDSSYIRYLERELTTYIDKCEKRMLGSFSILSKLVADHKDKPWKKLNKTEIEQAVSEIIDTLNSGEESAARKFIHTALYSPIDAKDYKVLPNGEIYLKTA